MKDAISYKRINSSGIVAREGRQNGGESLRLLELALQNVTEAVVITRIDPPDITYINSAFSKMTGYSTEEAVGNTIQILQGPKTDRSTFTRMFSSLQQEDVIEEELTIYRKDGVEFCAKMCVVPVVNRKGKVTHIISLIRDIGHRAQMEDALRESYENVLALLNAPVDSIVIMSPDGIVLALNQVAAQRFGLTVEEALGRSIYEFFPPEVSQVRRARIEEVLRTRSTVHFEDQRGEYAFDHMLHPVIDTQGQVVRLVAIIRDVTERRRMEEALRKSEARYRSISELTTDFSYFVRIESDGTLVSEWINHESRGHSSWIDIVYPDDVPIARRHLQILLSGQPAVDEFRIVSPDGNVRWAHANSRPVWDEMQGQVNSFYGAIQDITERKQVEDALRESEKRYRALVTASPDAITLTSLDGRILLCNQQTATVHGYDCIEEMIGKNAFDLVVPEERTSAIEKMRTLVLDRAMRDAEITLLRKDGSRFPCEVNAVTMMDENGQPQAVLTVLRDVTERKRAERVLQASEARWRSLVENVPAFIFTLDREGTFLSLNRSPYGGSLVEKVLGTRAYDYLSPEWQEKLRQALETVFRLGQTCRYESSVASADGTLVWLENRFGPVVQQDKIVAAIGIVSDITEYKRVEEELRKSEERFRVVSGLTSNFAYEFRVAPDGSLILDWMTDAFAHITGYQPEELWPKGNWMSLIHPEDQPRIMERFWFVLSGHVDQAELRLITKGGEVRWLHVYSWPVRDETQNRVVSVYGAVQDITERKLAEAEVKRLNEDLERRVAERTGQLEKTVDELEKEIIERRRVEDALIESEELYRSLIEASPDSIVLTDLSGKIQMANRQTMAMHGNTSVDELIGKSSFDLIAPQDRSRAEDNLRKTLEEGSARNIEYSCLRVDGSQYPAELSAVLVPDAAGKPKGFIGITRDIAHRKRTEQERERLLSEVMDSRERLRTLSLRLVEAQEAERRHIARELHDEIGQLLTGLRFLLNPDQQSQGALDEKGLDQARALVDDLIEKMQDLSLNLRPAMLDDLGLLPTLLWFFERYTKQTKLRVDFEHIGLEGRRFASQVETTVYRVVQESLTNVANHAYVNEVLVGILVTQTELRLRVQDSGIGFDAEAGSVARPSVGLAGMRERVHLSDGQFNLNSAPGVGTQVVVILPLEQSPEEQS